MSRAVTAFYDTRAEAETALARVSGRITASRILTAGDNIHAALGAFSLTVAEREACERELEHGGYALVAELRKPRDAAAIVGLLNQPASREAEPANAEDGAASTPAEETERIPVVEEELRVGKRETRRGGARVRSYVTETPVRQEVELLEERSSIERRPAERRLTEEEIIAGGLLQERVIEISEMREEPVVSKEAWVREEVVVRKNIERRIETIEDTVRRTEVEVEELHADRPAFGFPARGAPQP